MFVHGRQADSHAKAHLGVATQADLACLSMAYIDIYIQTHKLNHYYIPTRWGGRESYHDESYFLIFNTVLTSMPAITMGTHLKTSSSDRAKEVRTCGDELDKKKLCNRKVASRCRRGKDRDREGEQSLRAKKFSRP